MPRNMRMCLKLIELARPEIIVHDSAPHWPGPQRWPSKGAGQGNAPGGPPVSPGQGRRSTSHFASPGPGFDFCSVQLCGRGSEKAV